MKKKLPLYFLIAFIVANIIYMILAPLMIMDKIEKETQQIRKIGGSKQ